MSPKPRRAVVFIHEAVGKRIRKLSLSEPYPQAQEIYLSIEFEDDTETLIEIASVPAFGITHLVRDAAGELQPEQERIGGTIKDLMRKRGS